MNNAKGCDEYWNISSKSFIGNVVEPSTTLKMEKGISQTVTPSKFSVNLSHLEKTNIKKEILDVIIIDDTEPQENVCKLSNLNSQGNSNFDVVKPQVVCDKDSKMNQHYDERKETSRREYSDLDKFVNEALQLHKCSSVEGKNKGNYISVKKESNEVKYDNLKTCDLGNSESIKKEFNILDSVLPNSNVFKETKTSHDVVRDFITKLDESNSIDTDDILHLVELYKKEFKNYQKIIKTEQTIEAGLKLVESYQAERLKEIRSIIQKLLKNNSDSSCKTVSLSNETVNDSSSKVYEESPDIIFLSSVPAPSSSNALHKADKNVNEVPVQDLPVSFTQNIPLTVKSEVKQELSSFDDRPSNVIQLPASNGLQSEGKQTLKLLGKRCNVCGREAIAACQRCAKAFFCSDNCGKIFWIQGHEKICG